MSETFVPLVSSPALSRQSNFASLNAKAPTPPTAEIPSPACAKPTITLQRTGDIVSSIRVQCSCGQVVDVNCIY